MTDQRCNFRGVEGHLAKNPLMADGAALQRVEHLCWRVMDSLPNAGDQIEVYAGRPSPLGCQLWGLIDKGQYVSFYRLMQIKNTAAGTATYLSLHLRLYRGSSRRCFIPAMLSIPLSILLGILPLC